ncbi:MAG: tyrosine-type recombinase/integrase [Candidatus Rhabdochlamydia sp.]
MAVYQRINKDGTKVWRAVIRMKGYPTVCDHFERKQEALDWSYETTRQIKLGKYSFGKQNQKKTVSDLIDSYTQDGALHHHKSAKDTKRHLEYFKSTIGSYALTYVTPELLTNERKKLLQTAKLQGKSRTTSTANRYFSSLSGLLRYACRNLRWIDDNPCTNLLKLKENPRKRRMLTSEEELRLLAACKKSKNPYLYCITLIGLTTGARKGEILNLTWDCIHFENRLAFIKDSKNGKPRKVGLVDSVLTELRDLWSRRSSSKPLVFSSRTAFGKTDIKKAWQNALQQADIKDFVFHGLRHHFCSIGGEMGASGVQLRAQLGHSSSRMTDHYSHLEADATRFIGESIEQRILQGKNNG